MSVLRHDPAFRHNPKDTAEDIAWKYGACIIAYPLPDGRLGTISHGPDYKRLEDMLARCFARESAQSPYYTGWTAEDEARRLMKERVLDAELEELARETRQNQS
jgi:hypothetical protein